MSIIHLPPDELDARNREAQAARARERAERDARNAPLQAAQEAISAASRHVRHAVMASDEVKDRARRLARTKLREALDLLSDSVI